jgi:hypothetical protein
VKSSLFLGCLAAWLGHSVKLLDIVVRSRVGDRFERCLLHRRGASPQLPLAADVRCFTRAAARMAPPTLGRARRRRHACSRGLWLWQPLPVDLPRWRDRGASCRRLAAGIAEATDVPLPAGGWVHVVGRFEYSRPVPSHREKASSPKVDVEYVWLGLGHGYGYSPIRHNSR